jgi:hypothetical protein
LCEGYPVIKPDWGERRYEYKHRFSDNRQDSQKGAVCLPGTMVLFLGF